MTTERMSIDSIGPMLAAELVAATLVGRESGATRGLHEGIGAAYPSIARSMNAPILIML
jgi:hypothetical protein